MALENNLCSVAVVSTNGLRRSIDFVQTARGCVYSHQTLQTSRRAPPFTLSCHQVSPSLLGVCHCHSATQRQKCAASKQASTLATRKRQSRRKPLRSKESHPKRPPDAHSLGFCSRARVFARASKKAFLRAAQVRRAVQHPAAGRGAAATTSSNEKERHR